MSCFFLHSERKRIRNRAIVKALSEGGWVGQYGLKQCDFNWNVPREAPRLGDECSKRAHTSPRHCWSRERWSLLKTPKVMARKLAVQPWLPYWFCSAIQEAYFCPCWQSQETPLVLFYCFHFPVFICSFFGGWLFIMGPAEKKSTTEHKAQGWGDDLLLHAALHFCSPESNVERQFTLTNIHSLLMGHIYVCLPTISPMIDKCSFSCCASAC